MLDTYAYHRVGYVIAADTAQSSNLFKRVYEWFCGYQTKQDEESEEEKRQKLLKITSIKQNQTAKLLLQCLLVVILGAGVFILAFFSVPT